MFVCLYIHTYNVYDPLSLGPGCRLFLSDHESVSYSISLNIHTVTFATSNITM